MMCGYIAKSSIWLAPPRPALPDRTVDNQNARCAPTNESTCIRIGPSSPRKPSNKYEFKVIFVMQRQQSGGTSFQPPSRLDSGSRVHPPLQTCPLYVPLCITASIVVVAEASYHSEIATSHSILHRIQEAVVYHFTLLKFWLPILASSTGWAPSSSGHFEHMRIICLEWSIVIHQAKQCIIVSRDLLSPGLKLWAHFQGTALGSLPLKATIAEYTRKSLDKYYLKASSLPA